MLTGLHQRRGAQLLLGLLVGVAFGFLLDRGQVTRYEVIVGQLLFQDFTVVKVMLTAIIVGGLGVHGLRSLKLAQLKPKAGSVGSTVIGGLIFGVGFALLGYCPGTAAAAVGHGAMDALVGVGGMVLGAWFFAVRYPRLEERVLQKGSFGELTLPELLHVNAWVVVIPISLALVGLLLLLEQLHL